LSIVTFPNSEAPMLGASMLGSLSNPRANA